MPFKRGDIVLVLFPNSDLRTAKRRPVLLVQADELETGLAQVIAAMISSNLDRSGHPSRVTVRRTDRHFRASGLLTESVIMTDNLATLLETEIDGRIGTFELMPEVDAALRHTLAL